MNYPSDSFMDRNHSINQIVEDINKKKNPTNSKKVLAARRLPNENILVMANIAVTKNLLKHDPNWLLIIEKSTRVNRRKFMIMMHGMRVFTLNYSKQELAI